MESKIGNAESLLKVGDRITVEIGPIAHGGHFIARHKGQVIFVRYGITGEEAVVEITSVSSKLARGDAVEIIKASEDRVVPPCKVCSSWWLRWLRFPAH